MQILSYYKGYFVGSFGDHVLVPTSMPEEEKAALPLAKKVKVIVAFPLSGNWSFAVLGFRPGGATEAEEQVLNNRVFAAASTSKVTTRTI